MGVDNLTWEQVRLIIVSIISPILGYFTPTYGFLGALAIMFGFNIIAGMRADGITVSNCNNFRWSKFKNALAELFLYLAIILVVFCIMALCGDRNAALVIVKSLTYIFIYVYLLNSLRNLIKAYPENIALRIIYHLLRFELPRVLPSYWKPIIERIKKEEQDRKEKELEEAKAKDNENNNRHKPERSIQ